MPTRFHITGWSLAAAAGAATLVVAACTDSRAPTDAAPSAAVTSPQATQLGANARPKIGHVFILILENESATATFGPGSPAQFLADTLVKQGAFLPNYFGIGHASLDNYIAMISGQAPDSASQADCSIYTNFEQTGTAAFGQAIGSGCVFPRTVKTVANQLDDRHVRWRAYMEDMGNDPAREADRCGHVPIGSVDITNNEEPEDQYAARHNPFVWFHAITDFRVCQTSVVPLSLLESDLASEDRTPRYVFITPNVCHDGHDSPCVTGEPGGLVSADLFLREWVPLILNSPAFKKDGVLLITTDEAEGAGGSTACCNEMPGPNAALPGGDGPGGGPVGAVLLSRFIKPGTVSQTGYNHYSMLKSVEEIFDLPLLGFAAQPGLASFGSDVFTNPGNTAGHRGMNDGGDKLVQ